jgi:hypothetical protein
MESIEIIKVLVIILLIPCCVMAWGLTIEYLLDELTNYQSGKKWSKP